MDANKYRMLWEEVNSQKKTRINKTKAQKLLNKYIYDYGEVNKDTGKFEYVHPERKKMQNERDAYYRYKKSLEK